MGSLKQFLYHVQAWLVQSVLLESSLIQFLVIIVVLLAAWLISRFQIYPRVDPHIKAGQPGTWKLAGAYLTRRLSTPGISAFLVWVAYGTARHYGWPRMWFYNALIILLAWILSRAVIIVVFVIRKITNRPVGLIITLSIWIVAVLTMADLLGPTMRLLDSIALKIGGFRLSLLHLLEGVLILLVFIMLSRAASEAFAAWIESAANLNPSFQTLSKKLFKAGLYLLAIILALGGLGLDLTNLAWLSGALGLGLGIGLQKVISNVAGGFIILADRSIKPGDVIQVGETYGYVNHLKSRYVSVLTRDGVEFLIPNEDMITGRVVNWSYSNNLVRVRIPIGVSYGSDLELVMKLMLEAAVAAPRVLPKPKPSCQLRNFGDSSIDFELRVWINDPKEGLAGVKTGVYLQVWKRFKEHGIEIPFPQRVLHHMPMPSIKVETTPGA